MNKEKVQHFLKNQLQQGETLFLALKVNVPSLLSAAFVGGTGPAMKAVDARMNEEIAHAKKLSFPWSSHMVWAVGNHRLYIIRRGKVFGRLVEFLGAVDLSQISEPRVQDNKGLGDRLSFAFGGQRLKVDIPRPDRAAPLAARFSQMA